MKNVITKKPFKIIGYLILIVILISIFEINHIIDIQMHDTYFVISAFHISLLFTLILVISGIIYWLIRKRKLINWMTFFHVGILTISILTVMILLLISNYSNESIDRDYYNLGVNGQLGIKFFIGLIIFVISQIVFFFNLVISLLKNQNIE